MGVDQVEHESAFTLRLSRSHPNTIVKLCRREPAQASSGPDGRRANPALGWTGPRQRNRRRKTSGNRRCEGELPVVVVLGADCPEQVFIFACDGPTGAGRTPEARVALSIRTTAGMASLAGNFRLGVYSSRYASITASNMATTFAGGTSARILCTCWKT